MGFREREQWQATNITIRNQSRNGSRFHRTKRTHSTAGTSKSKGICGRQTKRKDKCDETQDRNLQRRLVLLDICRNGDRVYPVPLGGLDCMGCDGMKTDKRKTAQAAGTAKRGKVKRPTKNIPQKGSACKHDSMA